MVYRARAETIIPGVLLLLTGCGPEPASRGHVVLIGLDGASWNLLDPMVKAGQLPHFKALMDRGVSADLASVPPFLISVYQRLIRLRRVLIDGAKK